MIKTGGKNILNAVAGDILCAKEDGSKAVFDASDYDSIPTSWTPIGIVVIPPSHNVYGTGEGAAVSLKYMDYNNPTSGNTSNIRMKWGGYSVDTSLKNYNVINYVDNSSNQSLSTTRDGHIPSDIFTNIQCYTDPIAYYNKTADYGKHVPSPYLSDGSRNEKYYTTLSSNYNALSDFDGVGNTNILCTLAKSQSGWKTSSTITNNSSSGYYPAACCCWRYRTTGTNQGDWYLPAMGEIGYLMVRWGIINNSISNVGGSIIESAKVNSYDLWTSTEYSNTIVRSVRGATGSIKYYGKTTEQYVRSFIHF